jgi:NADPH:quinone reductase-like Zn-dependent oxidoreductase
VRAQVQRGFGGAEAVAVEDLLEPEPGPDEVVVAVRACGLNRLDLLQRVAPLVRGFGLPHVAGMDVAGVVVARGSDVGAEWPAVGDRVLVDPISTCGVCERCTAGFEPYCENLRTVGSTRHGGFAELVATPAARCHPIPEAFSFVEAACLPVASMTAWHALLTVGKVQPGEVVLVNAAGAGVSTAIVQFALVAGATVIGTAGGPEKVGRALDIGCAHAVDHYAIDHSGGGVADAVLEFTDGRGVDLVIDHVGPALFEASIRSLAIEGRMVFCGTTTGTTVEVDLPSVYQWGRTLIGAGGYRPTEFPEMLADVARHGLHPVVDSVHPFDRLGEAQQKMADGTFFGKIVVTFD